MKAYVRGRSLEQVDSSISMFNICESMKWNHLPNPGGIYQQDPVLLAKFRIIWREKNIAEEERQKEEERKAKAQSAGKGRRR